MSDQAAKKKMDWWWMLFWLLSLLSIPLLSLYGRWLQLSILDRLPMELLGLYLTVLLIGVVLVFAFALSQSVPDEYGYHLIWVAGLTILLYRHLPFVEKIHVGLFGLFGFLSYRVFRGKTPLLVCLAVAGLDELFQHFLSFRVGDWRDVWLNIFSGSLGMFLGFLLFSENDGRTAGASAKQ
ncbi:MAG: VanZ family protein [Thermodesulfobacteriota bacterium]